LSISGFKALHPLTAVAQTPFALISRRPAQDIFFWGDQVKFDGLVKSHFVNDFEHFGEKALMMFSVKTVPLQRD
jgi:hypothetical protein